MGKIVRALSEDGSVLCSAIDSTDIVREMAELHGASQAVTAALGRLATAASIMGAMLKYEGDRLTIRINGGGVCGTLTAVADYRGNVKCSVIDPRADAASVEELVGKDGSLTVIKDMGLKEPYCGQIPLVSGNIAQEITAYYSISEQLPTVCNMGTLFDENGKVTSAIGYMVQVVPPVSEKSIQVLEENLSRMSGISEMLQQKQKPEDISLAALSGLGGEILDSWEAVYHCDCSRERTEEILCSLGKKEIARLIEEQEETEVCCHFCNKKYKFSADDLMRLLKV
ncbi:MAG: Hsp33 family molecular chaperone HslO [Oscillospiraceae bacterium]|nr:Hsp33 family molecular chaperone HslO [Oscillospiraceae bacterium]